MKFLLCLPVLLAALTSQAALAHEFWMESAPRVLKAGDAAHLTLRVGEYFEGEQVGFSNTHAAAMRHYASGKVTDLGMRLPRTAAAEFRLPSLQPGAHLIAFDSQPSLITLSADKFHAYLHEEGLDAVIRQREADGTHRAEGRERYRRHVKHLLQVGGRSGDSHAVRTGQRLELLPLADPHRKAAGDALGFRLLFDGQPLAGALIKAWHKGSTQTTVVRVRSAGNGEAAIALPYAGNWMISVVHMVPAGGAAEADWDSFWGNLTFSLPERGRRR